MNHYRLQTFDRDGRGQLGRMVCDRQLDAASDGEAIQGAKRVLTQHVLPDRAIVFLKRKNGEEVWAQVDQQFALDEAGQSNG